MILAITAAIIAALAAFSQQRPQPNAAPGTPTGIPNEGKTFDYVIIGGGTAGLAVAARLVEGSQNSVAVVEAGGHYEQDNGNLSVVPGYCSFFAGTAPDDFNPLIDWGLVTEPQKVPFLPQSCVKVDADRISQGADDRRLHYPRGKTLGGSSARNFMYYHR